MAKRLECAKSTINRAFKESTKLKAWMTEARKNKGTPRAMDLNEVVADNARQATEPDPSDVLPDDDVNKMMNKLIQEAKPTERAQLHALDADERRTLVETVHAQNRDIERVKHIKRV